MSGTPTPSRSGLRQRLRTPPPLVATFAMLPRVEIVEMLGRAGFDAAIIDLEHGSIGIGDVPALAAAAGASGMFALARVADNSPAEIGRALDAGVDGVLVPHISSAEAAAQLVAAGRYAPHGERSLNPYTRGNCYWAEPEDLAAIDDRVALLAMLEGENVLPNLEAICDTPGLDAVFVGPVDLALSLGLQGDTEHPVVVDAVTDAMTRIRQAGCQAGVYAPSPSAAAHWLVAGASLVALSADSAMTAAAFAANRAAVDGALQRAGDTGGAPVVTVRAGS